MVKYTKNLNRGETLEHYDTGNKSFFSARHRLVISVAVDTFIIPFSMYGQ